MIGVLVASFAALAPLNQDEWLRSDELKTVSKSHVLLMGFVLEIDPKGGVKACEVFSPSQDAESDAFICSKLISRARFSRPDGISSDTAIRYVSHVEWRASKIKFYPPLNGKLDASGALMAIPRSNPSAWFLGQQDPAPNLRPSKTKFTAVVDPEGAVIGCKIVTSSGNGERDATACSFLAKKGSFYPARNDLGDAVVGAWTTTFGWSANAD
jgi:hypothetical protein